MTQIKNIFQRINQVMAVVESVNKDKDKKVNNQYSFVSHDAVAKKLHTPMVEAGIVMIPDVVQLIQTGNRTEVKMHLTFVNIDSPEDRFTVTSWGYGNDMQDKGIGKAVSYAVKYGLLKTFCLETGDDVEKDNINHDPNFKPEVIEEEAEVETLSGAQVEEIVKAMNADPQMIKKLCDFYKVKILKNIAADRYDSIMKSIKSKVTSIKEKTA